MSEILREKISFRKKHSKISNLQHLFCFRSFSAESNFTISDKTYKNILDLAAQRNLEFETDNFLGIEKKLRKERKDEFEIGFRFKTEFNLFKTIIHDEYWILAEEIEAFSKGKASISAKAKRFQEFYLKLPTEFYDFHHNPEKGLIYKVLHPNYCNRTAYGYVWRNEETE